ncbi:stage V sporulation protein AA [Crassaminicella thermophila]|uniref:Stage V sporulation protein AA n=1 Tax=Crassaminicella thermophila TaxID=2599308 RepID=A0A5C0SGV4_CRATE|nr:stage V sporulation protein AA [Crassaminicella thermophila]QEK12458.1 stage V sporulation protein AA [Crassaminicella thermophila]
MISSKDIYIQMKDGYNAIPGSKVFVRDVAVILADDTIKMEILNIEVLEIPKDTKEHIVVSILTIMEKISYKYPNIKIFPIGEAETLVKIIYKRKKESKLWLLFKLISVCVVLFVGSGLALMNFHADVNMDQAHKKIYKMITGIEENRPLILQIPYSLGIGLGMAVFFNHILPKKFRNEPSPMEVEMASYRKSMDEYILKNQKNTKEKE